MLAGYKINIQKSVAFLYTSDEYQDEKFLNNIFKNHGKKNPWNKLDQGDKNLFSDNYKVLIKETGQRHGKIHHAFNRTRTNNLKIYMKSQKIQNCQNNPE